MKGMHSPSTLIKESRHDIELNDTSFSCIQAVILTDETAAYLGELTIILHETRQLTCL